MSAKFRIEPVSGLGPYRKWVVYPPNITGYRFHETYTATLPQAFAAVDLQIKEARHA